MNMSQYDVLFDEKKNVLTLKEQGDKPNTKAISHLYEAVEGEIPDPASHPQPKQHLENLMRARGIKFDRITVKNDTKNPRLDKLAQEGREATDGTKKVITVEGEEMREQEPIA
jgi:hypothetical protein